MPYVIILLAQLVAAHPNAESTTVNMQIDHEREIVLTQDANGKPIRALLRRYDGKPMTCPTFFAWISSRYTCNGNCASSFTATGDDGSDVNRYAACMAARTELCAEATCSSGSYQFCSLNYSYSGWNGGTGSCSYTELHDCPVPDDCTVE